MQAILQLDIPEFTPYVFQIIAQLLELHPKDQGVPGPYQALLPPLLGPAVWESHGKFSGLVVLI